MPHQCTGCGHRFVDGSKEMLSGCPDCGGNTFQFRPEGSEFPDDPGETDDEAASSEGQADPPPSAPEQELPETTASSVAETVGRATTRVRDFVSSGPERPSSPDPDASWPSEPDSPAESGLDAADDGDIIDADARRKRLEAEEDDAQADARSDVVTEAELDGAGTASSNGGADGSLGNRSVDRSTDADADADTDIAGSTAETTAATDSTGTADLAGTTAEPPVEGDGEVVSEPSETDPDLAELREQLNDQFESIKIVEPGQYELNLMELYDREEYIIALQENGRYVIQVPEQWIGEDPAER